MALLLSGTAFSAEAEKRQSATAHLAATTFTVQADARGERAVLKISGPNGYRLERTFAVTESINVDLLGDGARFLERGAGGASERRQGIALESLPDGRYSWELVHLKSSGEALATDRGLFFSVAGSAVSRDQMQQRLAANRRELIQAEVDAADQRAASQHGEAENGGLHHVAMASYATDDFIRIDDGQADNRTLLSLRNTSGTGIFLENDGDAFQVQDQSGAYVRLHMQGVNSNGIYNGMGTTTPGGSLHIMDSNAPEVVLEQTGSPRWELEVDSNSFQVKDADFENRFIVEDDSGGTNGNQLVLADTGAVGIGTSNPVGNLHIFGAQSADTFNAVGPNGASDALNFGYSGSSFGARSGFFNVRPGAGAVAPNPAIYFMTGNVERLTIDNQGYLAVDQDGIFANGFNPAHPIHAQLSGARLTAAGVWTNASSRALKENIGPITAQTALQALAALEPVHYNYKVAPDDPQLGFIAEDVPEIVATPDRSGMAAIEVVALLTRVVQEQQRLLDAQVESNEAQEDLIQTLQERILALESQ